MRRRNRLKDAERLAKQGHLEPWPRIGSPADVGEQVRYSRLKARASTKRERQMIAQEQLARAILRDEKVRGAGAQ